MSRLKRKSRSDIEFKGCGGLLDVVDDSVKESFRINDKEFDYIADNISDEDINKLFYIEYPNFTQKREMLIILETYLDQYYKK